MCTVGHLVLADTSILCNVTQQINCYYYIIIIIIIFVIAFMEAMYNYIPEKNHFSRAYKVAAVLYLQFVPQVISLMKYVLYFTLALPPVCVCSTQWGYFL